MLLTCTLDFQRGQCIKEQRHQQTINLNLSGLDQLGNVVFDVTCDADNEVMHIHDKCM